MGDVDKDGRLDLAWSQDGVTYVQRATTSGFAAPAAWSTLNFSGSVLQGLADVTGDSRADMVAVNSGDWGGNQYVMASNGTSFGGSTFWGNENFTAWLKMFVGDVTGDHKADLVSVNHGSWGGNQYVKTSSGSTFNPAAWWGGEDFTTWDQMFLGDVTGDGKADLVSVNSGDWGGNQYVMRSSGSAFSSAAWWGGEKFTASAVMRLGDVNGDGKADLVAVNSGSWGGNQYVKTSTGSGFSGAAWWGGQDFKGSVTTQLGDVTGDGKADLIAINAGRWGRSVWVAPAQSGGGFGTATQWYYSTSAKYGASDEFGGPDVEVNTSGEADKVISALRAGSDAAFTTLYNQLTPADRWYVSQRATATIQQSVTYGGTNWTVDTDTEKDAAITALRARTDGADAVNFKNGLAPADQTAVRNRANVTMPSSVTYGGDNWKVDTATEADRFITDFRTASSDAAAAALLSRLAGGDSSLIDSRIFGAFVFGGLYRDPTDGKVWEFEDGTKAWITSPEAADEFGFNLASVTRASPGALAYAATAETIDYIPASDDADEMDDVGDFLGSASASPLGLDTGKTYSCTGSGSTVRNAGNKYAIGYCFANASITIRGYGKWPTKKTPAPGGKYYYYGAIGGNYKGCGWLQTPGAVSTSPSGNPQPYQRGCSKRGIKETEFASKIYDGWQQDRKTSAACTRWRNVDWAASNPSSTSARWDEKSSVTIPANTSILVRFKTRGGAFYMTRYVVDGARDTAWAFLSKNCVDGANWTGRDPVNRPSPATPPGYVS